MKSDQLAFPTTRPSLPLQRDFDNSFVENLKADSSLEEFSQFEGDDSSLRDCDFESDYSRLDAFTDIRVTNFVESGNKFGIELTIKSAKDSVKVKEFVRR